MELLNNITVQDFQMLHRAVGWKYLDNDVVKKSLKHSMLVVSAVVDGKTVGMARVIGDGICHGVLQDVIVLPEYQKRGIGTAMINKINASLQSIADKNDEFLLELLPTPNNEAFYLKCGMKMKPEIMAGMYRWYKNQNIYRPRSKKYVLHLHNSPFQLIKSGQKTIEMRLNDEKRKIIKPNDIIIFINSANEKQVLKTTVVSKHKYKDFKQLYKSYPKEQLGYKENENANPADMEKYYSKEQQQKYGVLALEIKLIKK